MASGFGSADIIPGYSLGSYGPASFLRLDNKHIGLSDTDSRMFSTREMLAVFDDGDRLPVPLPCGATRLPIRDAGWECTGRNLISVTTAWLQGQVLPVVLPARALDALPAEPWWDVQPFTGGDHLHLVPPTWPGRRQ